MVIEGSKNSKMIQKQIILTENLPLYGLRVLEFSTVLAGPAVGMFLAELGAEVIKIEPPFGDVTRKWKLKEETLTEDTNAISSYFATVNRGKKSICADLNDETSLQKIYELIKKSDIVLTNFKKGDDKKFELDYSTLSKLNSRLIYACITGYGDQNEKTGYDALIQAESGFMFLNRKPGEEPNKFPVAIIDLIAAHHLKEGILCALYQREKNGKGDYIHVSLWESAVTTLANLASGYLFSGVNPIPIGSEHPSIAPYGTIFYTEDGRQLVYAVGTDAQFEALCKILSVEKLSIDDKFKTNAARVIHREELKIIIANATLKHHSKDLIEKCRIKKIPCGLIQDVKEALMSDDSAELLFNSEKNTEQKNGLRTAVFLSDDKRINLSEPPILGNDSKEYGF